MVGKYKHNILHFNENKLVYILIKKYKYVTPEVHYTTSTLKIISVRKKCIMFWFTVNGTV